jgi:class 3 adenylate cyclase
MESFPTGTVTFLFADVEGSTRLVQTAGGAYASVIADVRRLLRAEISACGGIEVDATGDELSAVFEEVQPALQAALAGQAKIRDHTWPDGLVVKVRMGLHTGVPHLDEEGYTGLDVIRASRIASAGHGGQILLSSTAAPFATGVETRDLGTHRLQGLPDPERIHQVIADGLPRDLPPLRGTVSQLGDARRVVIADDSVLLREGVARLLEEAGFQVVAQSGTAEDLLRHVAMHKPDVAVVDIRMPRRTPTRGSEPRGRSAIASRTWASSFSPSTWSRATRWRSSRRARRVSATSSRTVSPTSSSSATPCVASPTGARRSIPPW